MLPEPKDACSTSTTEGGKTCETGIIADNMYRMSRVFAQDILNIPIHFDGHRVLHALLHRTCRKLSAWSPDARQPEEGYRARCVTLRETLGLGDVNGNRNIRRGVEDLKIRGIFQGI